MQGKFTRKERTVYPIVPSEEKKDGNEAVLSIDAEIANVSGKCRNGVVSMDVSRDGMSFILQMVD